MKEFQHLGVLFMNEGKMEREIDKQIGAASAELQALYRSVVVDRELSRMAKLSTSRPSPISMSSLRKNETANKSGLKEPPP